MCKVACTNKHLYDECNCIENVSSKSLSCLNNALLQLVRNDSNFHQCDVFVEKERRCLSRVLARMAGATIGNQEPIHCHCNAPCYETQFDIT